MSILKIPKTCHLLTGSVPPLIYLYHYMLLFMIYDTVKCKNAVESQIKTKTLSPFPPSLQTLYV